MLLKAIEKVQKEVDKASDELKAGYEAKLQELSERLREAEERSQRALSMAQQTRAGHVYVISNLGSFGEEVFKIGMTSRGCQTRTAHWRLQVIFSEDAPTLEKTLHRSFLRSQLNKVNPRKEFFRLPLGAVKLEVERLGVEAHWTMAAAAKEYRESLVIEQAMLKDPEIQDDWLRHQLEVVNLAGIESEDIAASGM